MPRGIGTPAVVPPRPIPLERWRAGLVAARVLLGEQDGIRGAVREGAGDARHRGQTTVGRDAEVDQPAIGPDLTEHLGVGGITAVPDTLLLVLTARVRGVQVDLHDAAVRCWAAAAPVVITAPTVGDRCRSVEVVLLDIRQKQEGDRTPIP